MPVYKVNFKRMNFSFEGAGVPTTEKTIIQSLDIPVEFDKITDENLEAFESKAWDLLFREFPSWKNHDAPAGCPYGWSTILTSGVYTKLRD